MLHRALLVFAASLLAAGAALCDEYRDARADLIAAYQAEDYAAMLVAADIALASRPGFPAALYNRAFSEALNHQSARALDTLSALLAKGVDVAVEDAAAFSSLRQLPGWGRYVENVKALRRPFGDASVVATLDSTNFIPEGIAINPQGEFILGSIRTGRIIRIADRVTTLSEANGHWSVFGMRFHEDGSLWFASAAVPQFAASGEDAGKAGLFRLDVAAGRITRAALLPQSNVPQVLGDLVIADQNTIYTTDSLTGAVYRYSIEADEFALIVPRGQFGSPQGLVLDPSGDHLYIADYIGGLYCLTLKDLSVQQLQVPDTVVSYGIDGLYRYGEELIAIYNGTRPHRVIALQLRADGLGVSSSRILASNLEAFDEPTLGLVRGDDFYFVANSHWNRFDRDNNLPAGLSGPILLKIPLQGDADH